jgi:hypothetical protein
MDASSSLSPEAVMDVKRLIGNPSRTEDLHQAYHALVRKLTDLEAAWLEAERSPFREAPAGRPTTMGEQSGLSAPAAQARTPTAQVHTQSPGLAEWLFVSLEALQMTDAISSRDDKKVKEAMINTILLGGAALAPKSVQSAVQYAAARAGVSELKALRVGGVAGNAVSTLLGAAFTALSAYATGEAGLAFYRAAGEVEPLDSQISRTKDPKTKLELTSRLIEAQRRKADSGYALLTGTLDTAAGAFTTAVAGMAMRSTGAGKVTSLAAKALTLTSLGAHLYGSLDIVYKILEKTGAIKPHDPAPAAETRTRDTPAGRQIEALYLRDNSDDFGSVSQRLTPAEGAVRRWLRAADVNATGKVAV